MPALLSAVVEKEQRRNVLDVAVPSSLEHMPLTHSCLDVFRPQLHVWNVYAGSGCTHGGHNCVYACSIYSCIYKCIYRPCDCMLDTAGMHARHSWYACKTQLVCMQDTAGMHARHSWYACRTQLHVCMIDATGCTPAGQSSS